MSVASRWCFACCLCVLWSSAAALAQQGSAGDPPADSGAPLSIAVAPFVQASGAAGEAWVAPLDVAPILIGRLAEVLPEGSVVPAAFALSGVDEPEAREVRQWASDAGVDAVVFGRISPAEGEGAVAVAVEVRSGHSGVATAHYEVARVEVEDPAAGVEILAESILSGLGYRPAAPAPETEELSSGQGSGFELFRKGESISIQSDELEVTQNADGRHIVFRNSVRVKQGDVRLRTDRLDAYYKKGESQPDRLEARGAVRLEYGERRARCDQATFYNTERRVVCSGRAALQQGCDLVRGLEIEFDLREERVRVTGAASVVIRSDADGACLGESS